MTIPIIGTTRPGWVRRRTSILALTAAVAFPAGLLAQQPPAPDNTKTNARDGQPAQVTADDQKNGRTDLQITQEIRKALVADKAHTLAFAKLPTHTHVMSEPTVEQHGPQRHQYPDIDSSAD